MLTNALSTVITNKIQKKYGLNNSEYLVISTIFGGIFAYLINLNYVELLKYYSKYAFGITIIAFLIVLSVGFYYLIKKQKIKKVIFNYERDYNVIIDCILNNIIKTNYLDVGHNFIRVHFTDTFSDHVLFSDDIIVDDNENNIHGIIKTTKILVDIHPYKKDEILTQRLQTRLTFITDKYDHDISFDKLINKIKIKHVNSLECKETIYIKIFANSFIQQTISYHKKNEYSQAIQNINKTYFNKNVNILNMALKTHSYYIKNFILYGEPGTGKSKFINLFAQSIQASIISINLVDFVNCKSNLYKLFNMEICNKPKTPNEFFEGFSKLNGYSRKFDGNICIVLEEIDYSIKTLLDIQKKKNDKVIIAPTIIDNKEVYIKDIDNDDSLEVSDLLELFQGLIEYPNRYVFATTNNFDDIKNIIPALFRNGRMTPINITFMTWDDLQNCVEYYYPGNILTIPKTDIKTSSSAIIELAEISKLYDLSFEEFEKKLNILIK